MNTSNYQEFQPGDVVEESTTLIQEEIDNLPQLTATETPKTANINKAEMVRLYFQQNPTASRQTVWAYCKEQLQMSYNCFNTYHQNYKPK